MNRGDVSFTFLHRIDEIELNIRVVSETIA